MRVLVLVFVSFFVVLSSSAQMKVDDFTPSGLYWNMGNNRLYIPEPDLDSALACYNKIHKADTLRSLALVSMFEIAVAQEQFQLAEGFAREGLALGFKYKMYHYKHLVAALEEQEKYEEELEVLDEVLSKYPHNVELKLARASLYYKVKDYKSCSMLLRELLISDYYYGNLHGWAGALAVEEKQPTATMLGMGVNLILEPGETRSVKMMRLLNGLSSYRRGENSVGFKFNEKPDNFKELDLLIDNGVSLPKKYRIPVKSTSAALKQFHLILSRLNYKNQNGGFFQEYYVPLYEQIYKQNKFEAFAYTLLKSSPNQKDQDLAKKHEDEIEAFQKWFEDELSKRFGLQEHELAGKKVKTNIWTSGGRINYIGKKENDDIVGDFKAVSFSGYVYREGFIDENKLRQGDWRDFYADGSLMSTYHYEDDELEGVKTDYSMSGNIVSLRQYKKGKLDGVAKNFTNIGRIKNEIIYDEGFANSVGTYFNKIGEKDCIIGFKESKYDGVYEGYHYNGNVSEKGQFKNEQRVGDFEFFHFTGEKSAAKTYNEKGELDGYYEAFFRNGKTSKKGNYKDGDKVGPWLYFEENGKLASEEEWDDEGNLIGQAKYYDIDGDLHSVTQYKKGKAVSVSFYNKEGKLLKENNLTGKNEFVAYTTTGEIMSKGKYVDGEMDGAWKWYSPHGVLEVEKSYTKGEKNGTVVYYTNSGDISTMYKMQEGEKKSTKYISNYESGIKQTRGWYYNDEKAGEWKYYYPNGKLSGDEYYIDGEEEGLSRVFTVNGELQTEMHFEEGLKLKQIEYDSLGKVLVTNNLPQGTGMLILKNQAGDTLSKQEYKYGVRHGKSVWYLPGGAVSYEANYLAGEEHGPRKWYYFNGKLKARSEYEYGEQTGKYESFSLDGILLESRSYNLGEKVGTWIEYNDSGIKTSETEYLDGVVHGKKVFYTEGKVDHIRYYRNGDIISYSYLGKDGKEVQPIDLLGMTVDVISYYPSGKVSRKYRLDKGIFDGLYEIYYESGQLKKSLKYEKGLAQGASTQYYPNGQKQEETNYVNDYKDGESKEYYKNGQLKFKCSYIAGERHGWKEYYKENGEVLKRLKYYSDRVYLEE